VGVILAVIGGSTIDKLHMEEYVEEFVYSSNQLDSDVDELKVKDRIDFSKQQVKDIVKRVWKYVLIGVFIGSLIHNYIPENIINSILGKDKWYSVLIATIVGIPMYADIFGTLPIAEALVAKGVGLGTALSFMMAVTALSLPSMIMLSKVVKKKLLGIFVILVTTGIIIIGYTFNFISYLFI
jgi:Predicted permeases